MFRKKRYSLENLLKDNGVDIDSEVSKRAVELFNEYGFEFDEYVYIESNQGPGWRCWYIRRGVLNIIYLDNINSVNSLQIYEREGGWVSMDYEIDD